MNIYDILKSANCLRKGEFIVYSDIKLPFYFDYSKLYSSPRYFDFVTDLLSEEVKNIGPNVIAGAYTSGYPLVAAISLKTNISQCFVRRSKKEYGAKTQIDGTIKPGDKVVLVDDSISILEHNIDFINAIKDAGGIITHYLTILDYDLGTREQMAKLGIEVIALTSLKELLSKMYKRGEITKEEKEEANKILRTQSMKHQ